MDFQTLLTNQFVKGFISGVLVAAAVDFKAFQSFKTLDEFAAYSWRVAAFRWLQGGVLGAVSAAGLNQF